MKLFSSVEFIELIRYTLIFLSNQYEWGGVFLTYHSFCQVSWCQTKIKRPLTEEDYTARHKFSFDVSVGGNAVPPLRLRVTQAG